MATYQRSDLAFPVGAFDLFSMSEGSGVAQSDIPSLVLANFGTVIDALLAGSGTNIDLNLVDGTILRLTGTWTIGGTFLNPTASGSLTGVLRMTSGGDALETISNSSVPFDVSYDVLTPANSVFNFPTIAQTIAANDTVLGGALNDYLKGFTGEDDLDGGSGGEDLLDGGSGNDTMAGGIDNDTYVVDSASDTVIETVNAGTADRVNASVNYTLAANVEVEILAAASAAATTGINLTGNNLVNTVIGNAGDNALDGGGAADTLQGLGGDDSYFVDDAGDQIVDTAGTDTVNASVSYALATDVAIETLRALNASATTALALTGNNLVNTVAGNAGDNVLDGAGAADTLQGLGGNNSYFVDNAGDQIVDTAGADTVNASVSYILATNVAVETLRTVNSAATAAISLTGNNLANTVTGNAGDNALDGGGAADTLQGLGGHDLYFVDNAGDQIVDTTGTDAANASVSYVLAADVAVETLRTANTSATTAISLTGNNLVNTVIGNAGDNALDGGGAVNSLQGLGGNDSYFVDNVGDQIVDTAGTDTANASVSYGLAVDVAVETLRAVNASATTAINLTGNNLINTVIGNAGDNVLDGGGAADTLQGLGGNDSYLVDNAGDQIVDTAGTDTVNASVSYLLAANVAVENLGTNSAAATTAISLTGNNVVNTLTGNAGNNTLDGGGAADTLQGLAGNDTYIVETVGDVVREAVNGGTDLIKSSVTKILAANVENLTLTGTAVINGTGNSLVNIIKGNTASNILDGGAGADRLIGGGGNDTYVVDSADVVVDVSGIDTCTSKTTRSLLSFTTVEKLTLSGTAAINGTGNALANTITGNGAANILDGGAGVDILKGGAGNDTYVLSNGTDKVADTAGIDTITSTMTRSLATFTTIEKLTLLGTAAAGTGNGLANIITGNSANNKLSGMVGNDTLLGGIGSDVLVGGVGKDTMTGGTGLDDFDFNLVTEMGKTAATRDVIKDFALGDDIDLSTIDANGAALGHTFSLLAAKGSAFTGVAGQLRWFQENPIGLASDKTIVAGDINGDRVADFQIELTGLKALTAADFVL